MQTSTDCDLRFFQRMKNHTGNLLLRSDTLDFSFSENVQVELEKLAKRRTKLRGWTVQQRKEKTRDLRFSAFKRTKTTNFATDILQFQRIPSGRVSRARTL